MQSIGLADINEEKVSLFTCINLKVVINFAGVIRLHFTSYLP
jgi:hypothetical protein